MIPNNTYEYQQAEKQEHEGIHKEIKKTRYMIGVGLAALVLGLGAQKCSTEKAIQEATPTLNLYVDEACYENKETHLKYHVREVFSCYHQNKKN